MKFNIGENEINLLYHKAEKKYQQCIAKSENGFLKDEISIPLTTLKIHYTNVKVVFSQENTESYVLEITLSLLNNSGEFIGKYVYSEDEDGNVVDDMLVFY